MKTKAFSIALDRVLEILIIYDFIISRE